MVVLRRQPVVPHSSSTLPLRPAQTKIQDDKAYRFLDSLSFLLAPPSTKTPCTPAPPTPPVSTPLRSVTPRGGSYFRPSALVPSWRAPPQRNSMPFECWVVGSGGDADRGGKPTLHRPVAPGGGANRYLPEGGVWGGVAQNNNIR